MTSNANTRIFLTNTSWVRGSCNKTRICYTLSWLSNFTWEFYIIFITIYAFEWIICCASFAISRTWFAFTWLKLILSIITIIHYTYTRYCIKGWPFNFSLCIWLAHITLIRARTWAFNTISMTSFTLIIIGSSIMIHIIKFTFINTNSYLLISWYFFFILWTF